MELFNVDSQMIIGTAYYPEHWPKERWQTDIDMMVDAGIKVLRLAELAWSKMEPRDGEFDFSWLDEFMELAAKKGLKFILGTPGEATPTWLRYAHPEIIAINEQGLRTGGRGQHCHNSDVLRFYMSRMTRKMAEHFADNPNVIGWQIDNELRPVACYCETCRRRFKEWMKKKYGTLDRLNEAWGTIFWSHVYNDWDEISLPGKDQLTVYPSLRLDFKRFISDTTVDYSNMNIAIIKSIAPHQFVAHNTLGPRTEINMYDLHRNMDFPAWDNYPNVDIDMNYSCFGHDFYRSTKHSNFWMLEQKNGYFNYSSCNLAIKPNLVRLWGYSCISRGANGVLFYRWRANRWGVEQNPNGILRHDGTPRRAYYEIKQLTSELAPISTVLSKTKVHADVAIIHSTDSFWSDAIQSQYTNFNCAKIEGEFYKVLSEMGVTADLVQPTEDLSRYKVVIACNLLLIDEQTEKNLTEYVRGGGRLLVGARTGTKDEFGVVVDTAWPGRMAALCGVTVDEFEAFPDDVWAKVSYKGKEYDARWWADVLNAHGAKTQASYSNRFYCGAPAITQNAVGKGTAAYLGVAGCPELYRDYLLDLFAEVGIATLELPYNVFFSIRESSEKRYAFLINFSTEAQTVRLGLEGINFLTGEKLPDTVTVTPNDLLMIELA